VENCPQARRLTPHRKACEICGLGVRRWVDAQDEESLYLSVLTFGEIRKGASLLPSGNRRTQLEAWLQIDLPLRFKSRVLPIDEMTAELWGAMAAEAQLKGIALAVIDGLVAATAKRLAGIRAIPL
jgi:toxin FitB